MLRLYLAALAEDPAHDSLALVSLNDTPADFARHAGIVAGTIQGKPLAGHACARRKAAFVRAALRAAAGAGRIVCGHVAQLPVAALAAPRGATLALVAHGIEIWDPLPPLRRLALRRCDRVYCVSGYTRDRLAANHPWIAPRLRVVPNALDPALLSAPLPGPPPADRPPTILCVGRLNAADAYKGYDLLLRAFAQLPAAHPSASAPRLRFVGDGDDLPRLRALAARLRVADRVEFTGRLSDPGLRQAFADCTCFALPSTGEGFGLVYLEALAAGRPCVAVSAAAVPELITPDLGLLAAPGDPAALAAALAACLARPWSPALLRQAALRYSYAALVTALAAAWR